MSAALSIKSECPWQISQDPPTSLEAWRIKSPQQNRITSRHIQDMLRVTIPNVCYKPPHPQHITCLKGHHIQGVLQVAIPKAHYRNKKLPHPRCITGTKSCQAKGACKSWRPRSQDSCKSWRPHFKIIIISHNRLVFGTKAITHKGDQIGSKKSFKKSIRKNYDNLSRA